MLNTLTLKVHFFTCVYIFLVISCLAFKQLDDSFLSLQRHGLKAKKLGFYDLLQTLAFKHCDGVVDIQVAPTTDSTDAVSIR